MKTISRVFTFVLALAMCLSLGTVAFAAEPDVSSEDAQPRVLGQATFLVSSDGVVPLESEGKIMPRSSISGYKQQTLNGGAASMVIPCTSSGWGGYGVTIQTSSSYEDADIHVFGTVQSGNASSFEGMMTTNDELQFHNLMHLGNVSEFIILFSTDEGTRPYRATVWIYG